MISGATSNCYQTMSHQQHQGLQISNSLSADHDHHVNSSSFSFEPNASFSSSAASDHQSQSTSLLYSLSILKEKVQHAKSLVNILISPADHQQQQQPHPESTTLAAIGSMTTVIQEIIVTASSMMFTCQQMALFDHRLPLAVPNRLSISQQDVENIPQTGQQQQEAAAFYSSTTDNNQTLDWFSENYNDCTTRSKTTTTINRSSSNNRVQKLEENREMLLSNSGLQSISLPNNNKYDIIELDAAELLAKYTHYCQVCGKGFKRDANLRMHMRAHGDEYKSSVALSNPMKHNISTSASHNSSSTKLVPTKYSCPQVGCRWNQKHAKFQPLKSMICVKNHYKRSHCPKMYVCKRCNRKQFSVLSDLRTHEKHCGDLRWQCSCGTTFSRKDKLMGHVALFVGHTPVLINSFTMRAGKAETQASQQIIQR